MSSQAAYESSPKYQEYVFALSNLSKCMELNYNEMEDKITSNNLFVKTNIQQFCTNERSIVVDLRNGIKQEYNLN